MTMERMTTDLRNRVMVIEVTPDLFVEVLKRRRFLDLERNEVVKIDGIPSDAEGIRAGINQYGNIQIVVSSNEFSSVVRGSVIPNLNVSISFERQGRVECHSFGI